MDIEMIIGRSGCEVDFSYESIECHEVETLSSRSESHLWRTPESGPLTRGFEVLGKGVLHHDGSLGFSSTDIGEGSNWSARMKGKEACRSSEGRSLEQDFMPIS